jgi:hypothetical protein
VIYIEYIARRPGISLEAFHAVAPIGQGGWAESYGDDKLLLDIGRTWRMGPEPEYLAVWWYPGGPGLGRVDEWERIFKSGDAARFEEPFRVVARIEHSGCYRELLDPVEPTGRPFYAELFDLAPGATHEQAGAWFAERRERHPELTLVLACLRIGRLGPDPAGLAFWQTPSYAALDGIVEELDGVEHPIVLRQAALYDRFGQETL